MRNLWKLLAVVVLTAGIAYLPDQRAACACSCAVVTPAQSADYADLVVVGTVTASSAPAAGWVTYTVAVEKVEKGEAPGTIKLKTSGSEASCGIVFDLGKRYRLYGKDGETGLCSGNTLLGAGSVVSGQASTGATSLNPQPPAQPAEASGKRPGDNVTISLGVAVLVLLAAAIAYFIRRKLRQTAPPE